MTEGVEDANSYAAAWLGEGDQMTLLRIGLLTGLGASALLLETELLLMQGGMKPVSSISQNSSDIYMRLLDAKREYVRRQEEQILAAQRSAASQYYDDMLSLHRSYFYLSVMARESLSMVATVSCPNLDMDRLACTYSMMEYGMSKFVRRNATEDCATAFADLVQKAIKKAPSLRHPAQIRFILVMLLSPTHDITIKAFEPLIRLIQLLPRSSRDIIANWVFKFHKDLWTVLIRRLKQCITVTVGKKDATSVETANGALRVMRYIFVANQFSVRKNGTGLPLSDFIVPAVNDPRTLRVLLDPIFRKVGKLADISKYAFVLTTPSKNIVLSQAVAARRAWNSMHSPLERELLLNIRRERLLDDTLDQLSAKSHGHTYRKALRIRFVGEMGEDDGGLRKEFFSLLVEELCNVDYGMFVYNEKNNILWFNRFSFETGLKFELMGQLVGLALNNGNILQLNFPEVLFKKILKYPVGLSDLKSFDEDIAHSMESILKMSAQELEESYMFFDVSSDYLGETITEVLKDGGSDIQVTLNNREEYVDLVVDWYLNKSIAKFFDKFLKGVQDCADMQMLEIFSPEEMSDVLQGIEDLEIEKLEKAARYDGGYSKTSTTVIHFWEIAKELNHEQRRNLLKFVTGSDRVPLGGLDLLKFTIGKAGTDVDKLPSAHTCFNLLHLPDYQDKEKLKKFLTIAIENFQGFGLC